MKDLKTGERASKVARREEQAEEVTTLQRSMRGRPEKKRGRGEAQVRLDRVVGEGKANQSKLDEWIGIYKGEEELKGLREQ